MNCAIRRNHSVLFLCLLKLSFILLTTESAAASTWQQGFDFRNTSTFVTDPSGDTFVGPTTAYPTKNNEGTFGWVKTSPVQARDRSTAVDPRLAGINFANNGAPATFYVDLPSPGTYNLSLALGDAGYQQCWVQCQIQFLDGSVVLATVTGGSVNPGYFYDATGKVWSAAAWPASNLSQQVTLTGTRLTVVVGTNKATGDFTTIAFLEVTQVSGGSGNYTISASPASLSVLQGNQGTSTISTAISGGFNSAISLSASGVPSGTTVSFNPNPIPAPGSGSSTMTIMVGASTATGTYPITLTGNGGGIQQNTTVTLTVTAAPNFTIAVSPASLSVQQGNQGTSTITTTISGGFNSAISLSASGVPSGTTVSFNPNPIPAPGSGSSTMTITEGASTATGKYPITVTRNGGGIQQNTTATLTVTAAPNFTIAVSPASLSVQQGNQGTSTITTTISGGFNSAISLSASGVPSGTTVIFNPNPIPAPGSGNSTMTITVGAGTATGTYPITVTGNGGGIQQNTTVTLTVTAAGAWQQGFDFRNTASYVTDPAGDTYVLSTTAYPTKGSGVTYGWVKTSLVNARDRNAQLDPRLAGINYANNGSPATFYMDLPSAGSYSLALALGDAGYQACWVQCQVQFLDGTTVLATLAVGSTQLGYFYDAGGKNWSASAWPTSNLSQQVTLAGTRLTVVVGTNKTTGDDTPIAFLGIAQVLGSQTFTMSASPASLNIQQGNQETSTITTGLSGGFNSSITLSASGMPAGTTASFNPNPIPAPGAGNSTMTITVGASTPVGTYPITVTGNGGGIQQNVTVMLTVTAQQQPNFTLSALPSSVSIPQGNQNNSTITTAISGGFSSAITLSASGMPSGTTVSFNSDPIAAPGAGSSTMIVSVGSTTPTGVYPLTVTGNGGGIQQNTTVTLTVTAAGQAAQVTNLTVTFQNGQTFISWNDPYAGSGAGTANAANYRYNIYRAIAPNCPISGASEPGVTEVQQGILNDSAILAPQTYHPWSVSLRTNLTNQQVTLGNGALPNPSGVAVYTATQTQTACYGVVTHDLTGTLSDSAVVPSGAVSESVGTPQPILQISCSVRGYCASGTGEGLLFNLPGSGAAPNTFGDLWSFWGDSTMAFQDGVQRAFTVFRDQSTYGTPMAILGHQDVAWWDTGLAYDGYGSLETYNFGYDYNGYAQTYTENYFPSLLNFAETQYQVDPNHLYVFGTSMGGFGAGIWAIRQPGIFALAIFAHPVWYWTDELPSMTQHSLQTNLGEETLPDGVTLYNTYSNTPAWLSSNCANNISFIIHTMGRNDTTTGVGTMWQDAMTAMNAMVTCHYGEAFTWNNGIHGSDPNPIVEFSGYLNAFRKNVSYPAFTGFSMDDNPCASGSPGNSCVIDYTQGACNTGSPGSSCHINLGWAWGILSDTSTQWSASITNSQITGLNTAAADLTPRNTQSFVASPGQTVNWTATGGQGGSVQADSYGLVTIPSVTFTSGPTIVTLTLQP